jgi:hypothetical protein
MVLNMSELNSMIARDLSRFYREKSEAIHALMGPLSTDQIWTRPFPYGNSIGHLLLHLTGNLNYYVGAEIAGTGYVRDRPLEFSDSSHRAKELLLKDFDAAIAMVRATLEKQTERDWPMSYSAKGLEQAGTRFFAFLICAAHMGHHTGQIIYLGKELERQKMASA